MIVEVADPERLYSRLAAEARTPALSECQDTRVAFLAYNSILPFGYWAEIDRPGCVPMRAWTVYEQIEHDQPGTPCRIHTVPHQGDLKAMIQDIRTAKSQADVVVVSMHWGIHFVPAVIAEYQREIGHAAIDSGADVIIGHHAHILKGIEVYKGKVIFYSLANFALEEPGAFADGPLSGPGHKELKDLYASPNSGHVLLYGLFFLARELIDLRAESLRTPNRLLKNGHLRYCPHPSSLRRTSVYDSLLRISGALHLGIFEQPQKNDFAKLTVRS